METRGEYVLVGGFVLTLLVLLVGAMLWLVQASFHSQAVRYDIYFEGSIAGLDNGSAVRFNGVPVGRVREIVLDPQNLQRVRVTIEVKPDTAIRTDAVAELQIQGLTGGAYVEISGASSDAPELKAAEGQDYPVIASRHSQLEQVFNAAPELLGRLSNLADQLVDMTNEKNRAALAGTLDNLQQFTSVVVAHKQDIDETLTDLHSTMKHADSALGRLGDASTRFDQLLVQAQNLVNVLQRLADSLERNPQRLFYGDRQQGYQPK